MSTIKGRHLESIVAAMEKSLSPRAQISLYEHLPSSDGRKRECDIVIREPEGARETVTIVEVQHRKKKTSVADMSNFVTKLSDVGAHRLVCVSSAGFSAGAIAKAKASGVRVVLMSASILPPGGVAFEFFGRPIPFRRVVPIRQDDCSITLAEGSLDPRKLFDVIQEAKARNTFSGISLARGNRLLGTVDAFLAAISRRDTQRLTLGQGEHTVSHRFAFRTPLLYASYEGTSIDISKASVTFTYRVDIEFLEPSVIEYIPIEKGDPLGWVLHAGGTVFGKHVDVRMSVPLLSEGSQVVRVESANDAVTSISFEGFIPESAPDGEMTYRGVTCTFPLKP